MISRQWFLISPIDFSLFYCYVFFLIVIFSDKTAHKWHHLDFQKRAKEEGQNPISIKKFCNTSNSSLVVPLWVVVVVSVSEKPRLLDGLKCFRLALQLQSQSKWVNHKRLFVMTLPSIWNRPLEIFANAKSATLLDGDKKHSTSWGAGVVSMQLYL